MPVSLDLNGRVAVLIGATSGLGRAIALGLAEHGADVVPAGRREDRMDGVCAEIEAIGRRTVRQTADARDRASIDKLRDRVLAELGRVDILVNAAGYTARKPTAEVSEEDWSAMLDTHLTGMLRACQSFYQPLKASGRGRIINITSVSAYRGFHEVAAYAAAKTGAVSLTRNLGCEWSRQGIMVNAIVPGVFPTELNSKIIMGTPRGNELLMRTPMGRFGRPEELVGAAVLLAGDGASYITGQSIVVDGGFLASGVNS